ncbi:hypothetical protein D9613_005991 [Agrocybe pediades]|uniref:Amidohydrolase 3 domain-containing protein n=1 Tax=Agrocybe pediades TaxID=84607 RepID=A0A8H4QTP2_9AGAR|nr:hypothetical protein D9613_005991 [Agrocybe pediades]
MAVRDGLIGRTGDIREFSTSPVVKLLPHAIADYVLGRNLFEQMLPAWFANSLRRMRVVYLPSGATVVPGLSDAHAHIIENGYMMNLPLSSAESAQGVVQLLKNYVLSHPDIMNDTTRWIEGMGWDHTKWPDARYPTADDLDQEPLLKNCLIALSRIDGHSRWVSFAVMKLIPHLPEKVDGGLIVRDESGEPTGIFVDNAMDLLPIPQWTENQMSKFFNMTITEALSVGLTSIHDADTSPARIQFYRNMAEQGNLPIRLYLMAYIESTEYWGNKITPLINYGRKRRLNLRSVKLFADGNAALLQPYSDEPETFGLMRYDEKTLKQLIQRFWADGWQTAVHCVGDRANKALLDIFEEIIAQGGNVSTWRPRIEHALILTCHDLERIGRLGVIPSVQPTAATTDMWYAETRLGAERLQSSYAYQTLRSTAPQNILPFGSDMPVEGVKPLLGFYAAISRLSVEGTSPHGSGGWFPNERLTREQALKGMTRTLDAAYASFSEDMLGSLAPGKRADFVIFDKNIMTIPQEEILSAKVLATVIDGEVVYGSF